MTSQSLRHTLITIILVGLTDDSLAGIISLGGESSHHEHHRDFHDHHKATSYMHFHGPVEGPEFEVKIPYFEPHHHEHEHEHNHVHEHHHHEPSYTMDYVAHPKYEYSYGVEDYHTGDFHSQKETRDGSSVTGEYSIAEPGGRLRVVTYHAGKDGFHATVHTHGKNDHSGYHQHQHHHHFEEHHPQLKAESSSHIEQHHYPHEEEQQPQPQLLLMHEYPTTFGHGHEAAGGGGFS